MKHPLRPSHSHVDSYINLVVKLFCLRYKFSISRGFFPNERMTEEEMAFYVSPCLLHIWFQFWQRQMDGDNHQGLSWLFAVKQNLALCLCHSTVTWHFSVQQETKQELSLVWDLILYTSLGCVCVHRHGLHTCAWGKSKKKRRQCW